MKYSKLLLIIILQCLINLNLSHADEPYSKRMANSQMTRSGSLTTWDYPNGLFVESILKVYNKYGDIKYYNYALDYANSVINPTSGKIGSGYSFSAYTLDNLNPGMFLLQIYETEKNNQYKTALDTLRKQISKQPRTNYSPAGGFWHKKTYPHQMWLDGLYMGCRFYAAYEKAFDNGTNYDDIVNQFVLIHSKTYDPDYQLNYHAWSALPTDANSFWANQSEPFPGCSKEFWARGLGWYAAALLDVLEILPDNYSRRQELVDIFNQVVAGIKRWQNETTGCWYQLLRYDGTLTSNGTHNYIEASSSCMYTYVLLKAIRLGLISRTDYMPVAEKAYQGLIDNFISEDKSGNLSLNNICKSAGLGPASNISRDGSINYYLNGSDAGQIVSNDLKGVGPFIMASIEYEQLNQTTSLPYNYSNENKYNIRIQNNHININSPEPILNDITVLNTVGEIIVHHSGKNAYEMNIPCKKGIYFLLINKDSRIKIII
ncbi:MAG: glycoside hydrolase family 88 protein [Paludibacter sp.]|nr:glycoside hydrolase family 88 protein [Paludibacter sp.]